MAERSECVVTGGRGNTDVETLCADPCFAERELARCLERELSRAFDSELSRPLGLDLDFAVLSCRERECLLAAWCSCACLVDGGGDRDCEAEDARDARDARDA